MKRKVIGVMHLTRYKEYLVVVTITTLLGLLATGIRFDVSYIPRMFAVLLANLLSFAFAFMINDTEDYLDDAKDKLKANRNPVSAKTISPKTAYFTSALTALASLIFYGFLGTVPFLLGIILIAVGFLYSWKKVRLKSVLFIDIVSHGLMLGGLQFLCAYFTILPYAGISLSWFLPFVFVVAISFRGQLVNQVRDFECDRSAKINNIASLVGIAKAKTLMNIFLVISISSFALAVLTKTIPLWVLVLVLLSGAIITAYSSIKSKQKSAYEISLRTQDPLLYAVLSVFLLWSVMGFL